MSERAYTVAEINRMRSALNGKHGFHGPWVGYINDTARSEMENNARAAPYHARVEDMLRTYMLAGVEPSDLENSLKPARPA